MTLNVARSTDEAERQSRGEDVTMVKEEKLELETFNPEMFEEGAAPAEAEERRRPSSASAIRHQQANSRPHVHSGDGALAPLDGKPIESDTVEPWQKTRSRSPTGSPP